MFDEQFIQGSSINGQAELYRGALIDPVNLMNITRKFLKNPIQCYVFNHKNLELIKTAEHRDSVNPAEEFDKFLSP